LYFVISSLFLFLSFFLSPRFVRLFFVRYPISSSCGRLSGLKYHNTRKEHS
jgi:hypothetical protein